MSERYIVKIQTETTGTKVLIYPENMDFHLELSGDDAEQIINAYGLEVLSRTFVQAEIDENGLLHLGNELEEQGW